MDEVQRRAKRYWRHKISLRFIDLIAFVSFLALAQFAGISTQLKNISASLSDNFYLTLFVYLASLNLIGYILIFPFSFYEGFVLEHKYSLSNLTLVAWFKDEFKKTILSFLIFSILIEAIYAISKIFQTNWWIIGSLFWVALSIIFAKIFPVLVIPLFYKCTPLTNDDLRNRILKLAKKLNIKLLDVFEINLSQKTKKSNAAIVGWGDTKRIIVADNLIREFTPEEVEVVVAHEMAHYKLNHLWKLISLSAASTILFFYILKLVGGNLIFLFGANDLFDIELFPVVWLIFILYGLITMPLQNAISRKFEKSADALALKATTLKDSFISLMERLAEKNLSDKYPNVLIEYLFYDHPPIGKRIESAKKILA